jgi:NADH-quinone oxidoreductase subunit N
MILAILPQIGLFVLGIAILILDLTVKEKKGEILSWVTALSLVVVAGVAVVWGRPPVETGVLIFGGMLRWDWMSFLFTMLFLFGGAVTALLIRNHADVGSQGEFYLLLLTSILGMSLMAGASDLVMLFLAIETTSIPLYILAGFIRKDPASAEAGMKYLIYGAATSAIMLYGFSLLFGMTGSTQIYEIGQVMSSTIPGFTSYLILILILVGLGFKISAFPFHFWAPDVYQGAPTPLAGFLSTTSKAAGFAVLMRLLPVAFQNQVLIWSIVVTVLSVGSMTFGNLQAMRQKNIKRLLAYSSIAQAGYMLIGVAAFSALGYTSVVLYLVAYMITNLTAFGIISEVGRLLGSDQISSYAGLSRRSPTLALALLAAFLSLAGIPPFAGFVGKLLLFSSAISLIQYPWLLALAIFGVINAIVALYYYLVVLKVVYLERTEGDTEPLPVPEGTRWSLVVYAIGIVLIGVFFSPWFATAQRAINSIFAQ